MRILVFLFLINIAFAKTFDEGLNAINLKITGFEKIETDKMFSKVSGNSKFLNANFKKDDAVYDIEVIAPMPLDRFKVTSSNLSTILISSYGDQSTPYSGAITNTAKCDAFFTPKLTKKAIKGEEVSIIKAFVGERFNFGICTKSMIAYESCSVFYYVKNISGFLKLKVMTKDQKSRCIQLAEKFISSIQS